MLKLETVNSFYITNLIMLIPYSLFLNKHKHSKTLSFQNIASLFVIIPYVLDTQDLNTTNIPCSLMPEPLCPHCQHQISASFHIWLSLFLYQLTIYLLCCLCLFENTVFPCLYDYIRYWHLHFLEEFWLICGNWLVKHRELYNTMLK